MSIQWHGGAVVTVISQQESSNLVADMGAFLYAFAWFHVVLQRHAY